jgi:hypothetical protein
MIGRILFGFCAISTFLVMLIMMLFFRNLPKLMRLFLQLFRQVLYLSYLIYYSLLTWIDDYFQHNLQINLLVNPERTIVCIFFSIILYGLVTIIRDKPISIWIAGCWALHGFLIGFLWKDFFDPDGLNMGENLW